MGFFGEERSACFLVTPAWNERLGPKAFLCRLMPEMEHSLSHEGNVPFDIGINVYICGQIGFDIMRVLPLTDSRS